MHQTNKKATWNVEIHLRNSWWASQRHKQSLERLNPMGSLDDDYKFFGILILTIITILISQIAFFIHDFGLMFVEPLRVWRDPLTFFFILHYWMLRKKLRVIIVLLTLRILESLRGYPLRVQGCPITGLDLWDTCSLHEALKFTVNEVSLVVPHTNGDVRTKHSINSYCIWGGLILW